MCHRPLSWRVNKESVGSAYCIRGSDKTQRQINNTPHLPYMSKTYYAKVMNVVAILPLVKLSDFLYRIKAKTLSLTFVTFVTLQI